MDYQYNWYDQYFLTNQAMKNWDKNKPQEVLLHKDKHMRNAHQNPNQPHQLDLFQMMINKNYSNSVELYQSLPDVFSWKQDKLRNQDGSLPVLSRQGSHNEAPYTLDISPANITVTDPATRQKTKRAFYKTVITEFVEHALHKLSVTVGFFLNNKEIKKDDIWLITTFYRVREELKRMGKNYSYEQIREWISILAGLRYELSGDICKQYGIDSFFSPIDLTIRNDKKNPLHSELYITFNKLISKKILALDWRSFNCNEFMKLKTSFGRTLFMRLWFRFQQADPFRGYHFLLSTLIKEGALQSDLITTNIKKIDEALKDCAYIIDRYTFNKHYEINPETNRRHLVDYKVTVYPTKAFQSEQFRVNTHRRNIENHRIGEDGRPMIKPMRDQYPTKYDYERFMEDKSAYNNAAT